MKEPVVTLINELENPLSTPCTNLWQGIGQMLKDKRDTHRFTVFLEEKEKLKAKILEFPSPGQGKRRPVGISSLKCLYKIPYFLFVNLLLASF